MLGEPLTVTIGDKEFKVEGFTKKVQLTFEAYMQRKCMQAIKNQRELYGDEYLEVLTKFSRDVDNGMYGFWSRTTGEFLEKQENMHLLMLYCLQVHDQTANIKHVQEWERADPEGFQKTFSAFCDDRKNAKKKDAETPGGNS